MQNIVCNIVVGIFISMTLRHLIEIDLMFDATPQGVAVFFKTPSVLLPTCRFPFRSKFAECGSSNLPSYFFLQCWGLRTSACLRIF